MSSKKSLIPSELKDPQARVVFKVKDKSCLDTEDFKVLAIRNIQTKRQIRAIESYLL